MRARPHRRVLFAVAIFVGALVPLAASARAPGSAVEDVTFDAEHVLEGEMDARLATLALTSGRLTPGAWRPTATLSWADTSAGLYDVSGGAVALGLGRGLGPHWGWQAFGFYSRASVRGDEVNDELLPLFTREVPFALPANADFSQAGGDVTQGGLGLVATRQFERNADREALWSLSFGLLSQRIEASDFTVAYQLTNGESAGARGLLDLSATYSYVTPLVDLVYRRRLGRSWLIEPRATLAVPRPVRAFEGRIVGPGFDLSGDTESADHGVHMGDPALVLGLAFEHRPTHLSFDVGGLLLQPLYESLVHRGVDQAFVVQMRWQGGA